ncbi:MAG TPA: hypothetical protein VFT36_11495 [Methylomirabilota bacterium]|nr:hypothetical protein [Methylomirabilota bacterium]
MCAIVARLTRGGCAVGTAALALAVPLAAQQGGLREVREWGTSGAALVLAVPTGYMGQFIDVAGGLDGFLAVNLGPGSPLALRFEGAFLAHQLSYGGAVFVVGGGPYTGPYGSVAVETNSASYITSLRAGPQLTLGGDQMQLYGLVLGGVSYFATTYGTASYDCYCGYYGSWDHYTLSGDVTFGWEAGGGLRFRLGGHSRSWLDVGGRYVRHDQARYLAAGPVVNGARLWQPVVGPADMVVLRVGVSVGLR